MSKEEADKEAPCGNGRKCGKLLSSFEFNRTNGMAIKEAKALHAVLVVHLRRQTSEAELNVYFL
jgi:hypothetical protein